MCWDDADVVDDADDAMHFSNIADHRLAHPCIGERAANSYDATLNADRDLGRIERGIICEPLTDELLDAIVAWTVAFRTFAAERSRPPPSG